MANVGVVIAAAGLGERAGAGALKQFRPIAGVPMLLHALRPFASHPRVQYIVMALPPDHATRPPQWLRDALGDRVRVVAGGTTRAASVQAALQALSRDCDVVLVHDAARPFVSRGILDQVIDRASTGVAAVAAIPVSDTLKRAVNGSLRVERTVDRDGLWRAQTPQGFPRVMLEQALARASDANATDDAALVEAAGFAVELVPDRTTNIKITTLDDFVLAEALAQQ